MFKDVAGGPEDQMARQRKTSDVSYMIAVKKRQMSTSGAIFCFAHKYQK
jgi:hypothetical protein